MFDNFDSSKSFSNNPDDAIFSDVDKIDAATKKDEYKLWLIELREDILKELSEYRKERITADKFTENPLKTLISERIRAGELLSKAQSGKECIQKCGKRDDNDESDLVAAINELCGYISKLTSCIESLELEEENK